MDVGKRKKASIGGKKSTRLIQLITFFVVIIIFLTILLIVIIVYNKYKRVKNKVKEVRQTILNIIPKMRVAQYTNIRYPKEIPVSNWNKVNLLVENSINNKKRMRLRSVDTRENIKTQLSENITSPSPTRSLTGQSKNIDKELAKFLKNFIQSAYNLSSGYDALLPPYARMIKPIGSNGFLFKVDSAYIIAYRGTNSSEDILNDIDFSQVPLMGNGFVSNNDHADKGGVMVHRGFYSLWEEQKKDIADISKIFKGGEKIYITGHSLGASTACFTALDLSQILPPSCSISLYLFAAPSAGNDKFINCLSKYVPDYWAIQNRRDMVTYLPPPIFSVFGSLWIYDYYRNVYEVDIEMGSMIDNHHLDTYIKGLDRPLDGSKGQDNGPHIYWNRPGKQYIANY